MTERRTDPRFPNVQDMIAYQAAQFEETKQALTDVREARRVPPV